LVGITVIFQSSVPGIRYKSFEMLTVMAAAMAEMLLVR
jgi:hypothetical protein